MNPKTEIQPTKQAMPRQAPVCPVEGEVTLTHRLQQVAELVAKGLANAEIAATLGITKTTVRWELRAIHRRTGQPVRLVRAAVLAVGLASSGPAAATMDDEETDDETDEMMRSTLPGSGLASSSNKTGNAPQGIGKTASAKTIAKSQIPQKPLSSSEHQVLNHEAINNESKQTWAGGPARCRILCNDWGHPQSGPALCVRGTRRRTRLTTPIFLVWPYPDTRWVNLPAGRQPACCGATWLGKDKGIARET